MDAAALVKLALLASIVSIVVSIGLGSRLRDVTGFLAEPLLAFRAMASMFLVLPLFVLGMIMVVPLPAMTGATLMALSVSPMPPIYPGKASKQGGGDRYVMSLFVLASIMTLIAAPLILAFEAWVLGRGLPFAASAVIPPLLMTVAAPLAVGIAVAELAPAAAARIGPPLGKLGMILLGLAAIVLLVAAWPALRAAVGDGTVAAIAAMVAFGLAAGHVLGGPGKGNRAALATATALRHPGIALPIATAAAVTPADKQLIFGVVILSLLINTVFGIVYSRWVNRVDALAGAPN